MDKEGNILIVTRGWLGGNRLLRGTTFTLNVSPFDQVLFFAGRGRQKLKYLYASRSSVPPGDSVALPFMPLDVLQALPDTLALDLTASAEVRVRASDLFDQIGRSHPVTTTASLFTTQFHWRLPLPHEPVADLRAVMPPDAAGSRLPSEYDRAEQRRFYYFAGNDYQYDALWQAAPALARSAVLKPDGTLNAERVKDLNALAAELDAVQKHHPAIYKRAEHELRGRAVYWQKRKIALLPTGGSTPRERTNNLASHLYDLQVLAICYQKSGDGPGRDRTLRELIQGCQALPQHGDLLRRQAEYALRTGSFSTDANYKGPS